MAPPTRTMVAPSSTATRKSLLMPIESSVNSTPFSGIPLSESRNSRELPEHPARVLRTTERRHGHQPSNLDVRHRRRLDQRLSHVSAAEAMLGALTRDVDLQQYRLHHAGLLGTLVDLGEQVR